MVAFNIQYMRLHNQLISDHRLSDTVDVLRWMVAVQAQDYFGALWAVGLRMETARLEAVQAAFESGQILRTHVMRPTWHFVAQDDIRWLLRLTAPRVHQANAYMYRQQKLDAQLFSRAQKAMEKALQGGRQLTRKELQGVLQAAGIQAERLRLAYIVMHAELEGLICSGPRRGKQFTYALLDERAPVNSQPFDKEKALAGFARRYFTGRGPASVQDFAYWSGLTVAEAGQGLEAVKAELVSRAWEGKEYWFSAEAQRAKKGPPTAHLLPNYDEYGMAYKDRGASFDEGTAKNLFDYSYSHPIIIDGQLAGSWRREIKGKKIRVHPRPLEKFSAKEERLLDDAAQRYAAFLGTEVSVVWGEA